MQRQSSLSTDRSQESKCKNKLRSKNMKAKLILIAILMTVIPILSSAQTQSGDDNAPTNPPGAGDLLLRGPGPTNVPARAGFLVAEQALHVDHRAIGAIAQNF